MRLYWQLLILLFLVSCSPEEKRGPDGGNVEIPERELTEVVCPVHQVPVFKVHASHAISCYLWDPNLGLTVEQIRNRFPYAIWDSNLHRLDESAEAKFPRYNLVCDRCQDSWSEYATKQAPLQKDARLEVHISTSGEIRIEDTQFDVAQLTAIAKTIAMLDPGTRVIFRIHKETSAEEIRPVVLAVEESGLTNFVFGSFGSEQNSPPKPAANKGAESTGLQPVTRP